MTIAEIIIFTLILVLAGTAVLYWRHKSASSNDGIDRLCKELQMLKSASVPEHIHLSTQEWAGMRHFRLEKQKSAKMLCFGVPAADFCDHQASIPLSLVSKIFSLAASSKQPDETSSP